MESNLKLVVARGFEKFGERVNKHINLIRNTNINYIVDNELVRFSNGEGKDLLRESVRNKDIYILTDVGNYGATYDMHGHKRRMSPDEHYQDIKRIISAISGHADKLSVIMPLLYQSRQDKRFGRESLDCAMALRELEWYGISELVTIDAHNPSVGNSTPCNMTFSNGYATREMIMALLQKEKRRRPGRRVTKGFRAWKSFKYTTQNKKQDSKPGIFSGEEKERTGSKGAGFREEPSRSRRQTGSFAYWSRWEKTECRL